MKFQEKEIQNYIWNHKNDFNALIEPPCFENEPNKNPSEFKLWELMYYKFLKEYKLLFDSLKELELFGCEVTMPKGFEPFIRADFLGCLNGDNGFVVCELKVNKIPERQAITELFAYANHVRSKFAPMGRKDIIYLLISPMKERIIREAVINNIIYDRNRMFILTPEVGETIDTLKLKVWFPSKEDFQIIFKSAFAYENIDCCKVVWKGKPNVWSPNKKDMESNSKMINRLNKVSEYAAQLMEASGINGFAYCSQLNPTLRNQGLIENGLVICGLNPFKATKTKFLYEEGWTIKKAAEESIETLNILKILPYLKSKNIQENYWFWMSENWSSCIWDIALAVRELVTTNWGNNAALTDSGDFTWDSFLKKSSEDCYCKNYDIHLTGILRELYISQLEKYYAYFNQYTIDERTAIVNNKILQPNLIDMLNSQFYIRRFLNSVAQENIDSESV